MSEIKPTVLIIDGHSLAFRAFYGVKSDRFMTGSGEYTNAVYGFVLMLMSLLRDYNPTHLAVAFDVSRRSFRTEMYPEYKGTRGETPVEFLGQTELLCDLLAGLGIVTLRQEGFEADDILATLADKGAKENYQVYVVSGDRDAIQLVNEQVTLLYPNRGVSDVKIYTPQSVYERYGVWPRQYPDVAALVGEKSDNLIGIDKVGEKTAVKWIQQYENLAGVLSHADEIKGVVGQKLREQQDNAVRNRQLNELRRDVDLGLDVQDLERKVCQEEAVREHFGRLEFKEVCEKMIRLLREQNKLESSDEDLANNAQQAQVVMFDEENIESYIFECEYLLNLLEEQASQQEPVVCSFNFESDTSLQIACVVDNQVRTASCEYAATALMDRLKQWMQSQAPKVLHDAKAYTASFAKKDITVQGVIWDTRIAAHLENSVRLGRSLALQALCHAELADQKSAEEDSCVASVREVCWTHELYVQQKNIQGEHVTGVLARIELPLIPVLVDMECAGVRVDIELLDQLRQVFETQGVEYARQAYQEIGREVNLASPKQLQDVLFDQLKMPKTRATKTGFSTDAASLAQLQATSPHPFLDFLLHHRDVTKLAQIVTTLERSVAEDKRIHTTYDPLGTATGRISSNDPNLQNIPVRTSAARKIRETFCVGEGYEQLLTADYSQIEMRIMAHLSEDEHLIAAFNAGEDLHSFVGSRIFGIDPSQVSSQQRTQVKAMSYGLVYGLGVFGLSQQLRISRAQAQSLMSEYFERFGAVRDYLRRVVEEARSCGYTTTLFGRRRTFTDLNSSNKVMRANAERQALNAPIQGSAADIMKIAMINLANEIYSAGLSSRMLLQVHDELIFEVAKGEQEQLTQLIQTSMTQATTLSVPLEVNIGYGKNWDTAAH